MAFVKAKEEVPDLRIKLYMMKLAAEPVAQFAEKADVIVVEGQEVYFNRLVSADAMIDVAQVAGAIAAVALAHSPDHATVHIPQPKKWKGQQPKDVNQGYTFQHFGLQYATAGGKDPYCYPTGCANAARIKGFHQVNMSDWEHIADAAGMARWAHKQQSLR